jgi:tetratricopeptide (TPR) repeat protein
VDAGQRLESWKEIAAYLNRSERTVRRWEEQEGLPVLRLQHNKRGSVYAYAAELDAWRESRRGLLETDPASRSSVVERPARRSLGVAAIVLAALAGLFWLLPRPEATTPYIPNPEAVRAYERGQFGFNAGRVQIETGIRYYQEAIRLDPAFSPAWAALATAHVAITWFGERPAAETMGSASREAQEAARLDPSNAGAWRVLGFVSHYLDWDHAAAEAHFRTAIELDPRDPVALSWFGDFLTDLRRFDEARTFYNRAHDANPRWLEPITFAANTFTITGNPDLAIAEQQRVLESEPNFGLAVHFLGRSYLAKGDIERAVEQFRKSNDLLGQVPFSLGDLGYALAVGGKQPEVAALLAGLMRRREAGYYPAFPIAQIRLGMGDVDGALEWLDRAADERHLGFYLPSADPVYDSIRSHHRFVKLMQRINIPVEG